MTSIWLAQLQIDPGLILDPWTPQWLAETVCSMLVGITCGVLGCFVVLRRMALIGDALAHAVLPGVVIAFIAPVLLVSFAGWVQLDVFGMDAAAWLPFGGKPPHEVNPMVMLVGALIAGLATAVLINLVGRFSRTKEDSAIGIVFTALFALGIILISALPRGTHFDLKCFLFGDPLAVGQSDLIMMSVICPAVLAVVAALYHRLKLVSFDPLVAAAMGVSVTATHYLLMGMLSATIVAGLRTTGVILVVAMVITPASAAYQLTNRFSVMIGLAGVFGAASAGAGMSLAFMTNSPTGPAMVLVAVVIFGIAVVFSPAHGVVFDRLRRRKLARHIANEDVLKAMYRLGPIPRAGYEPVLIAAVNLGLKDIRKTLGRLRKERLVEPDDGRIALTDAGAAHAKQLVRAHRLWETYLAEHAGVDPSLVHDEAERFEHAHGLAAELDQTLGHPATDPHGTTIPRDDRGG